MWISLTHNVTLSFTLLWLQQLVQTSPWWSPDTHFWASLRDLLLPWWLLVLPKPGNMPARFGSGWALCASGHGVQIPPARHLGLFGELLERSLILILLLLRSISSCCRDMALVCPQPSTRDAQNYLCLFQSKGSPISIFPPLPEQAVTLCTPTPARVPTTTLGYRYNFGYEFGSLAGCAQTTKKTSQNRLALYFPEV